MDEIETGFEKLMEKIEELRSKEHELSATVKDKEGQLLGRMAISAIPVVKSVGLNVLKMGKQDTKGELYDAGYYQEKMIILGKTEPVASRPDNPDKKVIDQFCVLSQEGTLFELMYSFDGFITDSYLNPLDPKTALEIYGYDVMFMLYQAMHDYLKGEEALVDALEKVIAYIYAPTP